MSQSTLAREPDRTAFKSQIPHLDVRLWKDSLIFLSQSGID